MPAQDRTHLAGANRGGLGLHVVFFKTFSVRILRLKAAALTFSDIKVRVREP